ncbi:spindle apparatus coiled-coil protein 1 spindly [Choristoneura fumiferana]|uniref:spindle apparatus coiled-coil protein 1 spindly n=1 Tax=Choristoneura fumiferana TaxID=7141 RepID=UPI003D158944
MDYSTISNKTSCTEIADISNGDLAEKYYSLKKQFDNLSSNFDATKQELHEATRNYNTALDVQRYLTAELESHQAEEARKRTELNSRFTKLQEDISALREERTELVEAHAKELKQLNAEIRRLKEDNAFKDERKSPEPDTGELDEARAALSAALADAAAAKVALEETKQEILSWKMRSEELASEMGQMRETAEARREEVRAATEREAAALADLAEARAMLHQCTDSQGPEHAAKGNSIFAEVEDKRQEMAKNLIHMKQTNARLRRDLANKQSEVEALLHEKQTVWEQQAGAAAHYDRELIESYEERISQLEALSERQRRELARWFSKLPAPGSPAPGWLPAVLDHLKCECERLRAEVLSLGAAQLASAAQVRDLRRKIALLSASSGNKLNANSPEAVEGTNKEEIPVYKTVQAKRLTPDEVKKKVSFN